MPSPTHSNPATPPARSLTAFPLVAPTDEMRRWGRRLAPLRREGSLLGAALVTPVAHLANDSFQFQTYLYAIFHRGLLPRMSHAVLMPLMQIAMFAVAAAVHPAVAGALAAVLAAWHGRLAWRHGVPALAWVTIPSVVLMLVAGVAWAGHPGAPAAWLVGLLAGVLQASSHAFEPAVPPRVSGSDRWMRTTAWFRATPFRSVVRAALMFVAGTFNELWASWRLWPVAVLDALWRMGFDPHGRAAMAALVAQASAQGNPAIDFIGVGGAWGGPYPAADPGPAAEPVAGQAA
jgi:hypothetical protein